eukprot:gene6358-9284_t
MISLLNVAETPISKALVAISGAATWLCLSPSTPIIPYKQKLSSIFMVKALAYNSYSAMLFGTLCLYSFRPLERYLGARKFGFAVVFLLSVTSVIGNTLLDGRLSVPIAIVMSVGLLFIQFIPAVLNLSLFGVPLSEKIWVVIMLSYFAMSSGTGLQDFIVGLTAAGIWSSFFSTYAAPGFISRFLSSMIPFSGSTELLFMKDTSNTLQQRVRQQSGMRARYREQLLGGPRVDEARPPTEENVQALQSMGFGRNESQRALQATGNNLTAAIDMLTNAS